MICRLWRGWTAAANADAYERLVRTHEIPGIEGREITGFRRIELMRRPPTDGRVEFLTLMWFDDLEGIRAFAGEDHEACVIPSRARELLSTFDARAAHYDLVEDRPQLGGVAAGGRIGNLPGNAALIVIDVQQGFDDGTWGPRNNPTAERNIRHLLAAWRNAGMPVHHVHHASTSPKGSFRPGTTGHQVKAEARPLKGEPIHVKTVNSGFIGTELERSLRTQGADTLVLVGLTTNHCVSTTTRMAGNLGFSAYLVADAAATFDSTGVDGRVRPAGEVHLGALSDLSGEFATITNTVDVLEALPDARRAG